MPGIRWNILGTFNTCILNIKIRIFSNYANTKL